MCSVGRGNVFSFLAKVFSFRPNVFTWAGDVFGEEGESSEGERRGGGALGMRAWTGWQVALGLNVALGPG